VGVAEDTEDHEARSGCAPVEVPVPSMGASLADIIGVLTVATVASLVASSHEERAQGG